MKITIKQLKEIIQEQVEEVKTKSVIWNDYQRVKNKALIEPLLDKLILAAIQVGWDIGDEGVRFNGLEQDAKNPAIRKIKAEIMAKILAELGK